MSTISVTHTTIGSITGKSSHNGEIAQFLGLQYATLKDRFATCELKQYDGQTTVDGSKLGPQVICHAPGGDMEQKMLLQHTLEYDRSEHYTSDLEGLNLSVTVPFAQSQNLDPARKLPVFAFIHGGGYNVGSSTFPQYDMKRLVKLSAEKGMPMIAVSLNYRLSAPGFMTSEELRSAGYKPNNALRDQRTALLWIQAHIKGFGGDPENTSLIGESAGAVSVSYHLHSKTPLFKRCMLMSGSFLLMPPAPLDLAEKLYAKAIKALNLDSKTPAERIAALNSLPGQDLCTKTLMAGIPNMPTLDNDLIAFSPTFENTTTGTLQIPGTHWCSAILLGDCQFDGNIQSLRLLSRKKDIAKTFCSSIETSLPGETASKLLKSYSLDPSTPDDEAFHSILEICNDLNFHAPTLALAQNLSRAGLDVYMYRFNEPNPWPGQWKGQAIHIQDLTWLLQNYNEFLEEPQREQAREWATGVVEFVNGKECWEKWREGERVARAIGPEGKIESVRDEPPVNGRRGVMFELAEEVGMDRLNDALNVFMRG